MMLKSVYERPILVTGCAGFIGYFVTKRLLDLGQSVIGIDNLNTYYDVSLKHSRLDLLKRSDNLFQFYQTDISNIEDIESIFKGHRPARIIHLAAQAGVRYSLKQPYQYIQSNVNGFITILEGARNFGVDHLVYASTSSVYGARTSMPFKESQGSDHPVSLYAATKKANELMAHSYSHLYHIPTTGLRFFTVYGPFGRPDMAYFDFTRSILKGLPIKIFNHGKMIRDFTYIDDIVESIVRVVDQPAKANPAWNSNHPSPESSYAPYRIYNIGNNHPVQLEDMICALEEVIGRKAIRQYEDMQPGDVWGTHADSSALGEAINYYPATSLKVGIGRFIEWYKDYYRI